MRRRWRVDAPGQGSARKMAAAVTFCRLLSRSGGAAALSLPQGARRFGVRTSPTGEKVTHTGQVSAAAWRASERRSPGRPRSSCRPRRRVLSGLPGPSAPQVRGRPSASALARRPSRARRPGPWTGRGEAAAEPRAGPAFRCPWPRGRTPAPPSATRWPSPGRGEGGSAAGRPQAAAWAVTSRAAADHAGEASRWTLVGCLNVCVTLDETRTLERLLWSET